MGAEELATAVEDVLHEETQVNDRGGVRLKENARVSTLLPAGSVLFPSETE